MRFRWLVPGIVLAQSLLIYVFVAQRFPLSGDDYSYLYQAKLFAAGKFYAEDPLYDYRLPLNRCIAINCLRDENGRRFSKYAPGWPAVLSLGVLTRTPWLVQPALAALLTFLLLGHVRQRLGPEQERVAALLLVLCLFFSYYGASMRPHLGTALCIFGAYLAYERGRRAPDPSLVWMALAGVTLGASALMRYTDWVPLGAWIAYSLARHRRGRALAVFGASFATIAAGNLAYSWILAGQPFVTPTHLGGSIGDHDRLTVSLDGLRFTAARLALVFWVFPPALLAVRYWRRARAAGVDATPPALFLANAAGYYLFAAAVGGPGPRYFFSYFPFLVVTVVDVYARCIGGGAAVDRRWWRLVLVAQIVGSLTFVARETYTLYWRKDVERTLTQASERAAGRRIVILSTGTYRTDAMDLTRNPPSLDAAATLYLANCGADDVARLEQRFAGRERFTYRFPGQLTRDPHAE